MLYAYAMWTMHAKDVGSMRIANLELSLILRVIDFWRKYRSTGYKPLSYEEKLKRTGSERINTAIRKRQLGFAGALGRKGD